MAGGIKDLDPFATLPGARGIVEHLAYDRICDAWRGAVPIVHHHRQVYRARCMPFIHEDHIDRKHNRRKEDG